MALAPAQKQYNWIRRLFTHGSGDLGTVSATSEAASQRS